MKFLTRPLERIILIWLIDRRRRRPKVVARAADDFIRLLKCLLNVYFGCGKVPRRRAAQGYGLADLGLVGLVRLDKVR